MGSIKIAIAEDHPELRRSMALILSDEEKLEVSIEAQNGQVLFEKLGKSKVDIVVLDIRMPVMDGIETLKVLKLNYPEIKVIMFSSETDRAMVSKMRELGANSFVAKNSPELLIDTIYEVYEKNVAYNSIFSAESN